MIKRKGIIFCGPTASGKTEIAHYFASKHKGEIINIDAMQIYKQIPTITCSPSEKLMEELPYHLYNFLDVDQEFSVIKYIKLITKLIEKIYLKDKLPIIVGGSGMYINTLLFGYNYIPPISTEIKSYVFKLHSKIGQVDFFNKLSMLDPLSNKSLNILDEKRTIKAYEVFLQTGKSIFTIYQEKKIIPLKNFTFNVVLLYPNKEFLHHKCNQRLKKIFDNGGIDEVKITLNNYHNISISASGAIGFKEICLYLNNKIDYSEALTLAQQKTRKYVKHQLTWFRNQIKEKLLLTFSNNTEFLAIKELVSLIQY